jgi:hypothetical protein
MSDELFVQTVRRVGTAVLWLHPKDFIIIN